MNIVDFVNYDQKVLFSRAKAEIEYLLSFILRNIKEEKLTDEEKEKLKKIKEYYSLK